LQENRKTGLKKGVEPMAKRCEEEGHPRGMYPDQKVLLLLV
jgi:hypothetical protein